MFTSTDVFLCLGRRGSGKSYLARRIQDAYPRKVIFDTLCEYADSDGIVVRSFKEFTEKVLELEHAKNFSIIFQGDIERESDGEEFNQALRVLYYRGNLLVCVEEIQHFSSTHQMPLWLRNSLLTGRHRNLALLFTTQRPGECHKTIISQCSHVFCGSLHEKNDIDYVRSVLGDRAFELSRIGERNFLWFRPGQPIEQISNDFTRRVHAPEAPSLDSEVSHD